MSRTYHEQIWTKRKETPLACYVEIDDELDYTLLILLQIVIGRAEGVDVCIPSDMISRRHALFKKGDDGVWTVTDNKVVQLCKSVKSGLVAVIEQFTMDCHRQQGCTAV